MTAGESRRLEEILRDGIEVLRLNASVGLPREVVRQRVTTLLDEGLHLFDRPDRLEGGNPPGTDRADA